ncbi:hypothetical protein [Photobacterium kishitanii]|uniref:Uncharacterized protein n=1 Tax=Photobacterium kishitanii TaxID=318456 RepID=A0A2T3KM57_9GAMM|nr:hypothetical protein [Photobacterium kishitanii]PSV00864.1 hypothetical protein C9J27_02225 [Photobacterium kishitanii]
MSPYNVNSIANERRFSFDPLNIAMFREYDSTKVKQKDLRNVFLDIEKAIMPPDLTTYLEDKEKYLTRIGHVLLSGISVRKAEDNVVVSSMNSLLIKSSISSDLLAEKVSDGTDIRIVSTDFLESRDLEYDKNYVVTIGQRASKVNKNQSVQQTNKLRTKTGENWLDAPKLDERVVLDEDKSVVGVADVVVFDLLPKSSQRVVLSELDSSFEENSQRDSSINSILSIAENSLQKHPTSGRLYLGNVGFRVDSKDALLDMSKVLPDHLNSAYMALGAMGMAAGCYVLNGEPITQSLSNSKVRPAYKHFKAFEVGLVKESEELVIASSSALYSMSYLSGAASSIFDTGSVNFRLSTMVEGYLSIGKSHGLASVMAEISYSTDEVLTHITKYAVQADFLAKEMEVFEKSGASVSHYMGFLSRGVDARKRRNQSKIENNTGSTFSYESRLRELDSESPYVDDTIRFKNQLIASMDSLAVGLVNDKANANKYMFPTVHGFDCMSGRMLSPQNNMIFHSYRIRNNLTEGGVVAISDVVTMFHDGDSILDKVSTLPSIHLGVFNGFSLPVPDVDSKGHTILKDGKPVYKTNANGERVKTNVGMGDMSYRVSESAYVSIELLKRELGLDMSHFHNKDLPIPVSKNGAEVVKGVLSKAGLNGGLLKPMMSMLKGEDKDAFDLADLYSKQIMRTATDRGIYKTYPGMVGVDTVNASCVNARASIVGTIAAARAMAVMFSGKVPDAVVSEYMGMGKYSDMKQYGVSLFSTGMTYQDVSRELIEIALDVENVAVQTDIKLAKYMAEVMLNDPSSTEILKEGFGEKHPIYQAATRRYDAMALTSASKNDRINDKKTVSNVSGGIKLI